MTTKQVRLRFAPSPTGMLHIGSARTALFNYLVAKNLNGKFLLRIEDTDLNRSNPESVQAIFDGLKWLGIEYDENVIFQMTRQDRHLEMAQEMLKNGTAYYAYDTEEELENMRNDAEKNGKIYQYNGSQWKGNNVKIPENIKPVIRLNVKAGKTILKDLVRGEIEFDNATLDDLVLVRSNNVPTYNMAVVVDDIDMNITHVIRGDDHISNTPKQILIYQALGKDIPQFAHLPMIHDIEGKKLSKRKNAVAVFDYRDMGYTKEAILNYLLLLGWNPGTEQEIFSIEESIKIFDIKRIGKSPSKFDFDKLKNINLHYIQNMKNDELFALINDKIEEKLTRIISDKEKNRIFLLFDDLKKQNLLNNIIDLILPFMDNYDYLTNNINKDEIYNRIKEYKIHIDNIKIIINNDIKFKENNDIIELKQSFNKYLKENNLKMHDIATTLRGLLIGKFDSVGIFKTFEVLKYNELQKRLSL